MSQTTVDVKEKKVETETIVRLVPIKRTGWLPSGHDGEYKFTGCETWLVPFRSIDTGQRNTGLDEATERRLEKAMRMPVESLSKYNEDYWGKYQIRIGKEGKVFDTKNPKDELDLCVCRVNPLIAKSKADIAYSPGAQFYISSEQDEAKSKNIEEKEERKAIKKYGTLSLDEMLDVLRVYAHGEGKQNTRYTKSTPLDLVESDLYGRVKENPEEFLRIVEDKSFKTRVLIDKLVTKRILIRSGSKYIVHGGDSIGSTLQDTIDYLETPQNQDVLISLKQKLEASE